MVVQEEHINSAVTFIILGAIICTDHVLDSTNITELSIIIKFPYFKSSAAISRCTWGLGDFGTILIAFLLEFVYKGDNLSCIGVCLFQMTGGGIVCVQVCEVNHCAVKIELLGFLDPVSFGLLEICEEVLAALIQ